MKDAGKDERKDRPPVVPAEEKRAEKPDTLVAYIVFTDPASGKCTRQCATPGCTFVDQHAGACSHLLQLGEGKRARKSKRPADF